MGELSLKTTVLSSVAVTPRTGALGLALLARLPRPWLLAAKRFQLKTMSSVVKGRPLTGALLCHLMPLRSLTVSDSLSGDHSHDSARSGMTSLYSGALPFRPGFSLTSKLVARLFGVLSGERPWLTSKWAGSAGLNHFITPPRLALLVVSDGLTRRLAFSAFLASLASLLPPQAASSAAPTAAPPVIAM